MKKGIAAFTDKPFLRDALEKRTIKSFKSAKELLDFIGKYSPDQERDERGRFGSGSGGGDSKPSDTPEGGSRKGMGDVPIGESRLADLQAPARTNDQVPSTASAHIVDGEFTPERVALHDSIVEKALDGIPPAIGQPQFYMLGGGPASGKTTAISSGVADVPSTTEAVHINADEIKEMLPETQSMMAEGSPDWAAASHEESSYISARIVAAAQERGLNVVLDGTGDTSEKSLLGKIAQARVAGFGVQGVYVTIPTDEAVDRANSRAERTGRVVDESVIRDTHASVSNILPNVLDAFDSVQLIDNTNGARTIMTAKNGDVTIIDSKAYNEFVAKGKG